MPILALPGVRDGLMQRSCPLVAVSPIVAGQAIKGPAARLMAQLGLEASAAAVAHFYGELLDGFVLDEADAGLAEGVKAAGVDVAVLPTIMTDTASKRTLAAAVLQFARSLAKASLS
jgi:LPPG:FO 2-phospho-L-lactate transferase